LQRRMIFANVNKVIALVIKTPEKLSIPMLPACREGRYKPYPPMRA